MQFVLQLPVSWGAKNPQIMFGRVHENFACQAWARSLQGRSSYRPRQDPDHLDSHTPCVVQGSDGLILPLPIDPALLNLQNASILPRVLVQDVGVSKIHGPLYGLTKSRAPVRRTPRKSTPNLQTAIYHQ